MKISILVFEGCISLTSIGSLELLAKSARMASRADVSEEASSADSQKGFSAELVSLGENPVISAEGIPVMCHRTLHEVSETDLILIPALDGDVLSQLDRVRACIPWILQMHRKGAELASICTGAFVLAEAGLLDGKEATTHWIAQELFQKRYPQVQVLPHRIIVDLGRIITCGGATSFLNLLMYLVEKYFGQEIAQLASKIFLIDINKSPQTAYAIFSTQKAHNDELVLKAQQVIENLGAQNISMDDLAQTIGTSRRNLEKRFKQATGNTLLQYLQRVRIEGAKKALEATNLPVAEIVRNNGYGDVPSFRRLFARTTGMTPSSYRQRYGRRAAV